MTPLPGGGKPMPRITVQAWTEHAGGPNPITGVDCGPHADKILGDVAGLSQFGVRLERLAPGSCSSHRHWHETEDEFVFVLSGALVLVEDEETPLGAGDAAGWAAGSPVAHKLENRSAEPAIYLVVGTRASQGVVHYPDHDVVMVHDEGGRRFTRSDGAAIAATGRNAGA
jgi:uncharacterized cupin superfamily protein